MKVEYAEKKTEWRKIYLINKFFQKSDKILDLGCGPGEYGPILKKKCKLLWGVDADKKLLKIAKSRGYNKLICKKIGDKLPFKTKEFDCIWCSEFLEHLPNLEIIDELERITKKAIVITLPNPISPHFKLDKTHVLKYSVGGLRNFFRKRKGWRYKVRGIGFEYIPIHSFLRHLTTYLTWYFPNISPTIAVIGTSK